MLNPAIVALLNDSAEHLRQRRPYHAHRLVAIADRVATKDRTMSETRREAIRAARLKIALCF